MCLTLRKGGDSCQLGGKKTISPLETGLFGQLGT